MENIQIVGRGKYIPNKKIDNRYLSNKFNIDESSIFKVSGIENRFYAEETIEDMAYKASLDAINNANLEKEKIDMIIVSSTSSNKVMPGISYLLQDKIGIKECICLDVLGGCSGYINAFDIARNYIVIDKVKTVLIVGVDKLSSIINNEDFSTTILLGDGAGATIISGIDEEKKYVSKLKSKGQEWNLLTYEYGKKLNMQGKKIYKYAVKEVSEIINETLEEASLNIIDLKYIILHQSNQRIMDNIKTKIKCNSKQMYTNIKNIGNTFCASIPIALSEIDISTGDKIMLCGYGGGLNTGCIILEI